jgi:hypothetical protein
VSNETGDYRNPVDVIYLAAWSHDARLTRICVASLRYFYPNVAIKVLAGGPLDGALSRELRQYWNVGLADLPSGDYGWGFVKLEPLFGPRGERFLVLDSDTVIIGAVLSLWGAADAPFLVDDEAQTESDTQRLYYDWRLVGQIDPKAQPPSFVFNSGQWFGTAGRLTREDFELWLEWTMPRRLRHPTMFMPGDQGVLNYVINKQNAWGGLDVQRRKIMRWPGHGIGDLDRESVSSGKAPPLIIHWAGMKTIFLRNMVGADLLQFFEDYYYSKLPAGRLRRFLALCRHIWIQSSHRASVPLKLRLKLWFGHLHPERSPSIEQPVRS